MLRFCRCVMGLEWHGLVMTVNQYASVYPSRAQIQIYQCIEGIAIYHRCDLERAAIWGDAWSLWCLPFRGLSSQLSARIIDSILIHKA
ncbi:hypothetical protein TU78_05745 [Pseudomonas taetrolens]|uniref:Uncharacterized protein n=1 Tax=Pseudomonas taetrolens TaxID=47884 RepID=A0A0J6GN56_PSETA|nr:hypothetical protein TU78_05745 [Pseudomonas taetrolens]